jgi:hypothetical protein
MVPIGYGEDPVFLPDGPAKVETRGSYWFFRPSTLPDEMGGKYLRMPKAESGPRKASGPHLEDGRWMEYEGAGWFQFPSGARVLLIFSSEGQKPGYFARMMTSEVLEVSGG